MASFAASALATPVQRQAVGWRGTICPLPRASPSRPARSEGATCSGEPSTSAAGSDRKYARTPRGVGPVDPNSPLNLSVDDLLKLRKLFDRAFDLTNVGNFEEAEKVWTEIIGMVPDRAEGYSNRGTRGRRRTSSSWRWPTTAKAIELEPGAIDPYLNRGVALEGLGRFEEAIKSYDKVLSMDSNDPVVRPRPHHPTLGLSSPPAIPLPLPSPFPPSPLSIHLSCVNNRGNANAGLGRWEKALSDYERATKIAKTGRTGEAVGIFRGLTAKYQASFQI
eukprot:tig00020610_g12090.t1